MRNNIKNALTSLRMARGRSLLTMLGIIVGVVAVVVTVSLGWGVKKQLSDQIGRLDKRTLVVQPGGDEASALPATGLFAGLSSSPLAASDTNVVAQSSGVVTAVPIAVGGGYAEVNGQRLSGGSVIATSSDLLSVLHQPVSFGTFFSAQQSSAQVVVIGQTVAEQLFQESAPIGRTLSIRGQDFIVNGVFDSFSGSSLSLGVDLNRAVFIPYGAAASLTGNSSLAPSQIFALVRPDVSLKNASQAISQNLQAAHAGQHDFRVLQRSKVLEDNSGYVNLLTKVFSAVAALSLLVGGIGIANIMLVLVSERTREIGIRKAVGATNRQILSQFLAEAATLSFIGGLVGVVVSLGAIFLIRILTGLHPVMNVPVLLAAPAIAWLVGVIFGVAPAVQAARKNPIDALRYE